MKADLTDITTNAIRYWEPRRIFYNLLLLGIVVYHAIPAVIKQRVVDWPDTLLGLLFLGVLANICYCFAYVPDLFVQCSHYRDQNKWVRRVILISGCFIAGVVAWEFAGGMFCRYGTW